jgi:DNA-binding MarR family transcriptional regulator
MSCQPPSTKFVEYVIAHEEPISYSEIQQKTELSDRTLTRALQRLRERNVIVVRRDRDDRRYHRYLLDR